MRLRLILALLFCSSLWAKPYRPFDHFWQGTKDLGRAENLLIFGAGSLLTLLATSQDEKVKQFFEGRDRLGGLEKFGNFWGGGVPSAAMAAGFIGVGLLFDRKHELEAGEAYLEGVTVASAATVGLKYTVRRDRPDHSENNSFPSGHTMLAFSIAGNLAGMYGPWAGAPALALGVLTTASRMADNVHYLSDTLFGATLGWVAGYAFTQHHAEAEKIKISFFPYFESRNHFGAVFSARGDLL